LSLLTAQKTQERYKIKKDYNALGFIFNLYSIRVLILFHIIGIKLPGGETDISVKQGDDVSVIENLAGGWVKIRLANGAQVRTTILRFPFTDSIQGMRAIFLCDERCHDNGRYTNKSFVKIAWR
jgi:hypothetical protein